MSKKNKPKKQKIRLYFRDGKTDVIPQKYWDDYEVNGGLFVVKKNGAWIEERCLDRFLPDGFD
jgi:hypothetical protein